MNRVVVYVAGKFRAWMPQQYGPGMYPMPKAPNVWEVEQNIRRAEAVTMELLRLGMAPICPHTMYRYTNGVFPDQTMLDVDTEILSRCDGIVVVEQGWRESEGTKAEVGFAQSRGMPILFSSNLNVSLDTFIRHAVEYSKRPKGKE